MSSWTRSLIITAGAAVIIGATIVTAEASLAGRRRAIVGIMTGLQKGMPRPKVEEVIRRYDAPFSHKRVSAEGIQLRARVGLAREWILGISFVDVELNRAVVWTEDGPYHPSEVPPDIR